VTFDDELGLRVGVGSTHREGRGSAQLSIDSLSAADQRQLWMVTRVDALLCVA
jgi:hypothetical protein